MPRRITRRAGLDTERVVRAAAALVDTEGAAALTINRLARELGVQPPSLYNHIGGLDDLWLALTRLNARQLGDVLTGACMGKSGPAGIRSLAGAYRAYIKAHPGLYQSSLRSTGAMETPDAGLRAEEERALSAVLAVVESLDLHGEAAVHAVRAFRAVVHGFATLEAAGGFGLPLDLDESFERLIETVIRGMK